MLYGNRPSRPIVMCLWINYVPLCECSCSSLLDSLQFFMAVIDQSSGRNIMNSLSLCFPSLSYSITRLHPFFCFCLFVCARFHTDWLLSILLLLFCLYFKFHLLDVLAASWCWSFLVRQCVCVFVSPHVCIHTPRCVAGQLIDKTFPHTR